jgi:hypothetical protein
MRVNEVTLAVDVPVRRHTSGSSAAHMMRAFISEVMESKTVHYVHECTTK